MERKLENCLICAIRTAGAEVIDELLLEVMDRKRQLYPDWDIWYHAYEKGKAAQMELEIRRILEMYTNQQNGK